jgi:hypothetical protein
MRGFLLILIYSLLNTQYLLLITYRSSNWSLQMKKYSVLIICAVVILLLVACGGGSEETLIEIAETETELTDQTGEFAMPVQTQLMIGIFLLEDTDLEVTAEQAPELITLWKALQALSTSDTSAEEEIDAVIQQIHDAMTLEQLQAIQEMELTQDSMATLMQGLDLQPGAGFPGTDGEGVQDQEPSEGFPPDGFPEGGFPGGGFRSGGGPGARGFGEGLDPEQMATLQAMREERGGLRNRASLFLINPIIELLEGKLE